MLLIDCGNSRVKAQFWPHGRVQASFAIVYRDGWCGNFGAWMKNLPAERCCFASVLDASRQQKLDACLAERFGEAVTRCISERERCGVINGYAEPGRLGVDRWLALIGAASRGHRDCVVIDAGSAMTVDLLRADGRHLGGAILPGFNTGEERFRRIFSHLDYDDPRIGASDEPGDSTEAAIQLNCSHDPMKRLRYLVTHWLDRLQPDADILLAGGDAARVQRELGREARIVPDLVFDGIARYAGE
jgi:type III pantothenate kinase